MGKLPLELMGEGRRTYICRMLGNNKIGENKLYALKKLGMKRQWSAVQ